MHSDDHPAVLIRPMLLADKAAVSELVSVIENFNPAEIECALELIDIYLNNKNQTDYYLLVAEDAASIVRGYACWGPVPMTKGAFDLYWIATHPGSRGCGFGSALMSNVEREVLNRNGRLLVVETSSKRSYEETVKFYRSIGYEETSRIKNFYDIGDDKLIFVKRFS
jgi:ribosomal protein S18 acetylase RimI-like enzyme